jgi:hypothetical protein
MEDFEGLPFSAALATAPAAVLDAAIPAATSEGGFLGAYQPKSPLVSLLPIAPPVVARFLGGDASSRSGSFLMGRGALGSFQPAYGPEYNEIKEERKELTSIFRQ